MEGEAKVASESSALLAGPLHHPTVGGADVELSIQHDNSDVTTKVSITHHKPNSHDEAHEEEREVTRIEMWMDALASIVVTLAVLPMMEILNEPKEERELGIPFLIFTTVTGFVLMSYILVNTYIAFNWFDKRHANDPIMLALGLLFLACLCLFAFAMQSLMQLYRDTSAVFFFGGPFIGIYLSSHFIFLYVIRTTEVRQKIPRSVIRSEIIFSVLVTLVFIGMMIASSLISVYYQNYIIYVALALLMGVHNLTRSADNIKAIFPRGYPQERIDLFTDGVYAVAATLFLIEIRFPAYAEGGDALAITFLKHEWRAVAGHFIAFAVLGAHWCLHNFISSISKHQSSTTYALSIGHCLAAALFPFTIKLSLLGEYEGWEVALPVLAWTELALTQLLIWLRARETIDDKWTKWLSMIGIVLFMGGYLAYELTLL